jgi:hypothetical protein
MMTTVVWFQLIQNLETQQLALKLVQEVEGAEADVAGLKISRTILLRNLTAEGGVVEMLWSLNPK